MACMSILLASSARHPGYLLQFVPLLLYGLLGLADPVLQEPLAAAICFSFLPRSSSFLSRVSIFLSMFDSFWERRLSTFWRSALFGLYLLFQFVACLYDDILCLDGGFPLDDIGLFLGLFKYLPAYRLVFADLLFLDQF